MSDIYSSGGSLRSPADLATFAAHVAAGLTGAEIARRMGVRRQRITDRGRELGLADALRENRQKDVLDRRERAKNKPKPPGKIELRFGLSREKIEELRSVGAVLAFIGQKNAARRRRVEWQMNLAQWWSVWENSGKWTQRGTLRGQYVMGRHGDVGPYATWNVEIITCTQNHQDANLKRYPKKAVPKDFSAPDAPEWAPIEGQHRFRSRVLGLTVMDGRLFAATERGLYRKSINGDRWRKIDPHSGSRV
jgi:hypothetical protein